MMEYPREDAEPEYQERAFCEGRADVPVDQDWAASRTEESDSFTGLPAIASRKRRRQRLSALPEDSAESFFKP